MSLRVYLAAPFFSESQVEREEAVKSKLRDEGFMVFSPKEFCHLESDATEERRKAVFKSNLRAMDVSDFILAITDEKDMGTIWESGYAYARYIPVIYFCETLKGGKFNLMLAESGHGVIEKREDINFQNIAKILTNIYPSGYKGEIE